jgi:uncharacterized protein involved in exopolysaccharide biosynthesis
MSQRALDVFFRHKVLILLPLAALVLTGLVAAVMLRPSPTYQASATVWTQQSILLDSGLVGDENPYLTPAQNQAQVFNDLLNLDSFVLSVAAKVPALAEADQLTQIVEVRDGTVVAPSGVNVLSISHTSGDPTIARDVVQGILDSQSERTTSDVVSQADVAEEFYETRLTVAKEDLDKQKVALAEYQASLPAAALADPTFVDPRLTELRAAAQRVRDDYDALLDRLESIYLERDSALKGRDLSFQVADAPQLPTTPVPTSKVDLLLFPLLGFLLGFSASGALLFAMTRLDETIRLPREAQDIAPVLAVVPDLGRKRRRQWPRNFVRQVVFASRGLLGSME